MFEPWVRLHGRILLFPCLFSVKGTVMIFVIFAVKQLIVMLHFLNLEIGNVVGVVITTIQRSWTRVERTPGDYSRCYRVRQPHKDQPRFMEELKRWQSSQASEVVGGVVWCGCPYSYKKIPDLAGKWQHACAQGKCSSPWQQCYTSSHCYIVAVGN